jgi:hypothetical protein
MSRKFVFTVILLILLTTQNALILATPVSQTLTKFSDATSEKIIIFPGGGGADKSAALEIPKKAVVTDASFNVSTVLEPSGNYPEKPYIDVGSDGDREWSFGGTGYGRFGQQNTFTTGQPYKENQFNENETFKNETSIYLPKNATVTSASMGVSAFTIKNVTVNFGSSGNSIPFWGVSFNSYRFQTLYYNTSINYEGIISKIFFKAWSTTSTAKYQNFTLKLCNTTTTSLSTTFSNNYGGNTPTTVYQGNITLKGTSGQWFEIDVDDLFYFDNQSNLLVEILWNGDNGVSIPIHTGNIKYNARLYASSWTATTGSASTLGYTITLGFGGGIGENVTVDIGADGKLEFNHTGNLTGMRVIHDFDDELNNFTSSYPVAFTDGYGIQFVKIPINLTNDVEGALLLSDLDIRYDLTTTAFINPHNTNLINELNELIPDTGEGNIIIPFNIVAGSSGKLNVSNISVEYFIPELTNDRLLILNGHGPENICYADYENYTFIVNVTNVEGIADLFDITLILSTEGDQIKINWSQSTSTFNEVSDPKNLITLDTNNCLATPIDPERLNLQFSVRFNWDYSRETLEHCALNTTNDTGMWVFNYFEDVYRVENDLDFIGTLEVESQYQGELKSGDWVRSQEFINWSNLTVVYEKTTNIFPDDKNFNITITDNDDGKWVNTTSSGKPFTMQTQVDVLTDKGDMHFVNITDIPGVGEDKSLVSFIIRVDADGPLTPPNIVCHADSAGDLRTQFDDDTTIFVTWDPASDNSCSGVERYAMEFNNPIPFTAKGSGGTATGVEGLSTFYVRALDRVGNWGSVGSASITIDLTDLVFSDPYPDPEIWQNYTTVNCGVLISDISGSGVNNDSIYYRFVEKGNIESGEWRTYRNAPPSGESIQCSQDIAFKSDGIYKKVQWRARDLAQNIVTDPNYYSLKIDSTPVVFDGFSIDFNKWHRTDQPRFSFYVNETKPENDECSGVDIDSIQFQFSTEGLENYGPWVSIVAVGSGESVKCWVDPTFAEGDENFIRFRSKDLAGNERISEDYQVRIDLSTPTFSNPTPEATFWNNNEKIQCNITVADEFSKVDVETVRYSMSTNGTTNYGKWSKIGIKHLPDTKYYSITLSANETFVEGENNYIRWWAFDSAGNNITSEDYLIRVDITGCSYANPDPTAIDWRNTESVLCSISINDTTGSGVDQDSIEYALATGGPDNMGIWRTTGILKTVQEVIDLNNGNTRAEPEIAYSIRASILVRTFNEGVQNFIYWRAMDLARNEYTLGGPFRVQIDLSPLDFYNPKPNPETVQFELEQTCRITVRDDTNGSGVNSDSIEYRYSTTGKTGFNDWSDSGISSIKQPNGYQFIVFINFKTGSNNLIQWRASDIAENGPFDSQEYKIVINSPPVPKITSPRDKPDADYDYTDDELISFNAQKTYDPDGVDILSFYWESNKTGPLGSTDLFKHELPAGLHMITLYVSDNHNHNVSIHVNITVAKLGTVVDTDGDGIPDISDPDIDNDDYPNEEDAFPYNKREWLDTDFDGVGNNVDADDDGDGHTDEEDAYPLDASRWKKEEEDSSWMYILIVIIVLVVVGVVFSVVRIRSKKKKAEEERAKEQEAAAAAAYPGVGAEIVTTPTLSPFSPTMPMPMPMPMPVMPLDQAPFQPPPTVPPQSLYMPMPGQLPMLPPVGSMPVQTPIQPLMQTSPLPTPQTVQQVTPEQPIQQPQQIQPPQQPQQPQQAPQTQKNQDEQQQ